MAQLHLAVLCASLFVGYKLFYALYNILFNPLRHFPGPALARISRLWLLKVEMSGNSYLVFRELHKIHGKIVRIAPDEVSIDDHAANGVIYGQGSKFEKAKYFYGSFENQAPNLFTICEKDAHGQDKRLMSNSFSRSNIVRFEDMMYSKVVTLMDRMKDYTRQQKPIPLFAAFRCLTLDTISDFCFGQTVGALKSPVFDSELFKAFDLATPSVPFFQHFPGLRQLLRWVSRYDIPFIPNGFRGMEQGAEAGLQALKGQEDNGDKITMFQDMIDSARKREFTISADSLVSEGVLMLFAGTDTTAATLANGAYHLAQQPKLWHKLQQDLRQKMNATQSRLSIYDLEKDGLLEACLKESLRLTCPVRGRLPRIVPKAGWTFEGHHFKPGTIVSGSLFSECYDESVFPRPFEFIPERWLVEDTSLMLQYYHPFSRGTRQCIGQNLSLIEQYIAFSELVLRFNPISILDEKPECREFITLVVDVDFKVKLGIADTL